MEQRKVGRRALLAGVGGAVAGSLLPGKALATGSLNPPPGGVTYQGRDLASISAKIARAGSVGNPLTNVLSLAPGSDCLHEITTDGSFCMTESLHVPPGVNGIRITASHVDFQMCGFSIILDADPGGAPTNSGIVCTGSIVTLSDGNVSGGRHGLDFELANESVIWDMTVDGATGDGARVGNNIQCYDVDFHRCGTGVRLLGSHSWIEHCGAWTCGTGFKGVTSGNILLRNCATGCPVSYDLGNNSYATICVVTPGDLSPNTAHRFPESNYQLG